MNLFWLPELLPINQPAIRPIDFTNPADKASHERMVALVEQMLSLHQRQIEATDRQIDRLIYELYGLNEEEIRIVEGKG